MFAQHSHDISVNPTSKDSKWGVDILAANKKDQLIVGRKEYIADQELLVFDTDGSHVSTINPPDNGCHDATWTSSGNIVCTLTKGHQVITISLSGDVIASSSISLPRLLSVTMDNVICLADWYSGVHQSIDERSHAEEQQGYGFFEPLHSQIVGEGATELVHIGQLGLAAELDVDAYVDNVFNFPTMAEAYRIAALDIVKQRGRHITTDTVADAVSAML